MDAIFSRLNKQNHCFIRYGFSKRNW